MPINKFCVIIAAVFLMINVAIACRAAAGNSTEHWERPATAIGKSLNPVQLELAPESCATCHPAKYDDWSGSLHSRSVGVGLTGQLHPDRDPGFAASCYFCHAPLAEQAEQVETENGYNKNPSFDAALKSSGVSCAACHVRDNVVYGPTEPMVESKNSIHRSVARGFFSDSEFCAACHQHEAGYSLEGKLLVNTYREWTESRYAAAGVTCQACHMSGRRHLFRGIHDPGMTRSGVEIEASAVRTRAGANASLRITNTGAGHYFPTYVTPEVRLSCFVMGPEGGQKPGTLTEEVISRRVTIDLEREVFDTRLAPGESRELDCELDIEGDTATTIVVEATVLPDEFYERFFTAVLDDNGDLAPDKRKELEQALDVTRHSPYTLYRREFHIDEHGAITSRLKTPGETDERKQNTKESD